MRGKEGWISCLFESRQVEASRQEQVVSCDGRGYVEAMAGMGTLWRGKINGGLRRGDGDGPVMAAWF